MKWVKEMKIEVGVAVFDLGCALDELPMYQEENSSFHVVPYIRNRRATPLLYDYNCSPVLWTSVRLSSVIERTCWL